MLNNINENQELVAETLDGLATSALFNPLNKKLKDNQMLVSKKPKFNKKFRLTKGNNKIDFSISGQKAKALYFLAKSDNGITALEICGTFALRLSEYVRAFRHDCLAGGYNLNIETIKEENPSGWHGRYFLLDKVEVIEEKSITS